MTNQEKKTERLLKAAVLLWGPQAQLDVLKEECAELIVAASHYKRGRKDAKDNLIEEIADVELMCQQARYIIEEQHNLEPGEADAMIDHAKAWKVDRTYRKIERSPGVPEDFFD